MRLISKNQNGIVLPISLIMLALMTLLGVSTLNTSVLSERMSGNYNDMTVAFEAAEAALRDAEQDIVCSTCRSGNVDVVGSIQGLTGFASDCGSGLCYFGNSATEVLDNASLLANAVDYGSKTSAMDIPNISQKSQYIVEGKKIRPPGSAGWKTYYQVTAIGYGRSTDSRVVLREKYIP